MSSYIRPGELQITLKMLANSKLNGGFIIDACCGSGATVDWLNANGFTAAGIDINGTNDCIQTDVKDISRYFHEGSADGIICECGFSLLSGTEDILASFHKTLRSGGVLMMSDLYLPGASKSIRFDKMMLYTNGALTDMLSAGFEIIYFEDFKNDLQEWVLQSIFDCGYDCLCGNYPYRELKLFGCSYYALAAIKR